MIHNYIENHFHVRLMNNLYNKNHKISYHITLSQYFHHIIFPVQKTTNLPGGISCPLLQKMQFDHVFGQKKRYHQVTPHPNVVLNTTVYSLHPNSV